MSTVSLIIPVHNRWPMAERTFASIAAQTRLPDHLIIVDNNSDADVAENIKATAENLGRIMKVSLVSCIAPGAPAARNAGLKPADTDWTMFFDSDDIMLPDHIAVAMAEAESNSDADIVGWDAVFVDPEGNKLKAKNFPTRHYVYNAVMHGSLATQCYMARTELFRNAGGWNPEAKIWNDMELSVRLLMQDPKIVKAHTPHPTVHIVTHPNSITGPDFSSKAAERDHTIDILIAFAEKTDNRSLVPILALKRALLAARCQEEGQKVLASDLYTSALTLPLSPIQRLAVWFGFRYTALSLPGAARLLMPFFT